MRHVVENFTQSRCIKASILDEIIPSFILFSRPVSPTRLSSNKWPLHQIHFYMRLHTSQRVWYSWVTGRGVYCYKKIEVHADTLGPKYTGLSHFEAINELAAEIKF